MGGVQGDAAFLAEQWIAVHEHVLQREVVRNHLERILHARAVADLKDVSETVLIGRELEIPEDPMVTPGRRPHGRERVPVNGKRPY
jgi:hypothetical protein